MLVPKRIPVLLAAVLACAGLVGCSSSQPISSRTDAGEETINTGYGTQKKSESTTAASNVDASESDKVNATNLAELLRGRTAGVHVSSRPGAITVRIRGATSIRADQTPLYVLDGMPVEPNPDGTIPVNPINVKSITVLKDAGATAIYGSRGANGVIVIETKSE
jgi:TonB-dependent SusC/RagA subfamily outer membrane receptor